MGWNWDAAPNVILYQSRDKGVRELFQQIHHFSVISPSLMTWWRVGWSIHTRSRHAWGWFSRFLPTKLTQVKSRRVSCKPRIYIYKYGCFRVLLYSITKPTDIKTLYAVSYQCDCRCVLDPCRSCLLRVCSLSEQKLFGRYVAVCLPVYPI